MDKMTGKKRLNDESSGEEQITSKKLKINEDKIKIINDKDENIDSMNKLVDECFNDFIKGDTKALIENYNLLKLKFFDSL